jgi:hypothetical protein
MEEKQQGEQGQPQAVVLVAPRSPLHPELSAGTRLARLAKCELRGDRFRIVLYADRETAEAKRARLVAADAGKVTP